MLVTVDRAGQKVDAVAAVTKIGNTLLLDRVTGKPLFSFRLRRAPVSTIPGEQTSPYQPDVELPQPFARQEFKLEDVTDISPQAREFVLNKIEDLGATYGWFKPFDEGKPLVMYGFHGGAEWTGGCVDPATGLLYVSSSEILWTPSVHRNERPAVDETKLPPTPGRTLYEKNCMPCHGPNREGLFVNPSLLGLSQRLKDDDVLALWKTGRAAMPVYLGTDAEKIQLLDYLFDRDRPNVTPTARPERPTYRDGGYPRLLDPDNYPGCKPPWGKLTAIDLNTGKIAWQVPLGEHEELTKKGIPKTGTENFGGPLVTAGGLVFCAGTRDLKVRAFDKSTGAELWSHQLDHGAFAPPATYSVNGKQYVVLTDTGGGKLSVPPYPGPGRPWGDGYVAFRLP
jgi:quinoprotein glucose dehydrogenase